MKDTTLHPLVHAWFIKEYGEASLVQKKAWPLIADGANVLALAPTGSGKTLAAFLVALSRFADGSWPAEELSVVYISPLKALNEDIRRNLLEPVHELSRYFNEQNAHFPTIRVETRSGDTPQSERRRFYSKTPSILATTPESLAILLLNPKGRAALSKTRCIILDEIHALLPNKRGAFLACQIGRLNRITGDFQRIALSATIRSPETAAAWVGGWQYTVEEGSGRGTYTPRAVRIVDADMPKKIDIQVLFPQAPLPVAGSDTMTERYGGRYMALVEYICDAISKNRSTLVFTDSRRRAERLAFLVNERTGPGKVFAHHGSLAKEVRRSIEKRLASAELPCVIATGSLELGIDIGSVDEVLLVGVPSEISSALQRIGRSGHTVGLTSKGRILPFHGMELLAAGALASAVKDRDIETVSCIENPLDILSQLILALCTEQAWDKQALYNEICSYPPFRSLTSGNFDLVLNMLMGYYQNSRIRELKPRLQERNGLLQADASVLFLLYSSGGTIPDRGSYALRLNEGQKIGELDEEFVWERRPGDTFSFGSRSWRIVSIGTEAVHVVPLDRSADFIPFWKAEERFRSPILSERIMELLASYNTGTDIRNKLSASGMDEQAYTSLFSFLEAQRTAQGDLPLPEKKRIGIEHINDPSRQGDVLTLLIHCFRGGAVNYPVALSLSGILEEILQLRVESIPNDDGILLVLPRLDGTDPWTLLQTALRQLSDPAAARAALYKRLEASGLFGAAFRQAAGRAMLLPKNGIGKRTPLWITRRRSKRLFEAVKSYQNFPVSAEAWRTCLVDFFDMQGFEELCRELAEGSIELYFFQSRMPSPFAREAVWRETNRFLYEGDDQRENRGISLSDSLIEQALGEERLRPALPVSLVQDFEHRLKREAEFWTPENIDALCDLVKERCLISYDEWEQLIHACPVAVRQALDRDKTLGKRLYYTDSERQSPLEQAPERAYVLHVERLESWKNDKLMLLGEWLHYQGPVRVERIAAVFMLESTALQDSLDALELAGELVRNVRLLLHSGEDTDFICDRENLELLLRLNRAAKRPQIRERPAMLLFPFIALRQGLLQQTEKPWELLSCMNAPLRLWEAELFPARNHNYKKTDLDAALAAGKLLWFSIEKEKASFCTPEDLDLAFPDRLVEHSVFPYSSEILDFWQLRDRAQLSTTACVSALWKSVWDGTLSCDSWEPVRKALRDGFDLKLGPDSEQQTNNPLVSGSRRRLPRALKNTWRSGIPVSGHWFFLGDEAKDCPVMEDPLDQEELDRDRVRLLLKRWGILCRPLLEREHTAFSWSRLLPAMRRMELAGELCSGRYFAGINSLQFASPSVAQELEAAEAVSTLYWMNAADPANISGSGIEGLDSGMPQRNKANRIYMKGADCIAATYKNGKDVHIFQTLSKEELQQLVALMSIPKKRDTDPERKLVIQQINGSEAASSPYAEVFREEGFEADRGRLILW